VSIDYPAVLAALQRDAIADIRAQFEPLTVEEATELGTFIGPDRLTRVARHASTVTAFRPRAEPADTTAVLAEVNRQAFAVAPGHLALLQPDPTTAPRVGRALVDVAARRRAAPLLIMPQDVTGFLPLPPGAAPAALSEGDYAEAAARQQVEVAAIKAVAIVESGGLSGFDDRGRPKILFEAHHFSQHSANRYNATHPHLSVHKDNWRQSRLYYGRDQYQRLHEAMLLDIDAALKAASWGKFQVMGFNHSGWDAVRPFVLAMYQSEANHLRAFEAYCNDRRLMDHVRNRDWLAFAQGYNGRNQEGYDTRMAAAYRAAGGGRGAAAPARVPIPTPAPWAGGIRR